jgi:type II secretory pathway component PulK
MSTRPPFATRGAALLLVLWAIAVVSFAVVWVATLVNLELDTATAGSAGVRARAIALSGVALGLHPGVEREDTQLLNQDFGGGERLEVRLRGEGARFNINVLLAEQDRLALKNLLALWEVPADEADRLIDALIDWTDEDDLRLFNGAERREYELAGIPDAPPNRPFRNVGEMAGVRGMDAVAARRPDWADAFTVFGDGKIDVNEASAEILQAAAGLTPEMAAQIVAWRVGPDGVEATEDDVRFESIEELEGWLVASSLPPEQAAARLTTESPVKRIDSRGIVGDRSLLISVVAGSPADGRQPEFLLWEEK